MVYQPDISTEPNLGSNTIVIHPGSFYLRAGFASNNQPVCLPHCIARRHKNVGQQKYDDAWLFRAEFNHPISKDLRMAGLNEAIECLQSRSSYEGISRKSTKSEKIIEFNRKSKPEYINTKPGVYWTDVKHTPEYLIGQDALMLNPAEAYNRYWPIRRGLLNIHDNVGGSISSIMQDLSDIWTKVITDYLFVDKTKLNNFRVILLIPDCYKRAHVKEIVDMLINSIGFGSFILVQESVSATFGSGLTTACVVDVGDQKTSVCCVEDGLSQLQTRISLKFGGSDISRSFHWLLRRQAFPFRDLNPTGSGVGLIDAFFIQDLKETCCHMDHHSEGAEDHDVSLQRPSAGPLTCIVRMGDERILAPMSLFFPNMFALKFNPDYVSSSARWNNTHNAISGGNDATGGFFYGSKSSILGDHTSFNDYTFNNNNNIKNNNNNIGYIHSNSKNIHNNHNSNNDFIRRGCNNKIKITSSDKPPMTQGLFHLGKRQYQISVLAEGMEKYKSDPSDLNDEDYLIQTTSAGTSSSSVVPATHITTPGAATKQEQPLKSKKKDSSSNSIGQDLNDDSQLDDLDSSSMNQSELSYRLSNRQKEDLLDLINKEGLVGIDKCIIRSIEMCETEEMKLRMYSCILVVGGGANFEGFASWLRFLIWNQLSHKTKLSLDNIDVVTKPKDIDSREISWRGACILSYLDASQEMWISQREWNKYGVKILREKSFHVW